MKRLHFPAVVLLAGAVLASGDANAQARGPAAEEVLENGQDIQSRREQMQQATRQTMALAAEQAAQEQENLRDPAYRARKFAELDTWFRRMPGRFRIEGRIEKPEGFGGNVVSGKVTGVADCIGIGEGVGLQCILDATWPIIESTVVRFDPPDPPTSSDMLRTFNPAVLVIGLNLDPPGIRAQMVNADSLSHTWVGKLTENTARANRLNRSLNERRIQPLEIIAEPDGEVVTLVMRSGLITLTLAMYFDPAARAENPMKPVKVR